MTVANYILKADFSSRAIDLLFTGVDAHHWMFFFYPRVNFSMDGLLSE